MLGLIKQRIKYRPTLVWVFFLIVAFLFFGSLLFNFFVSDDFSWLQLARDFKWQWDIFLTNYEGGTSGGSYNPLLLIIFKIFYSLFGSKYFLYHLVSIILHASNAFLVYILSRQLFSAIKLPKVTRLSLVAGFLFLIWPTQVEAIAWISAWPHLWATFFFLLSLIAYFQSRFHSKEFWYLSLVFFTIAIFIKESAMSLPFVILLWEIYFVSLGREYVKIHRFNLINLFSSFVVLLSFLFMRYGATGLTLGYYGKHTLKIAGVKWIGNMAAYVHELITFSYNREIFFKFWYYYGDSLAIIFLVVLAAYFFYLLKKYRWFQFTLTDSLFLALMPFMPITLHRTTFAGERYLYLPVVFFVIWLVLVLKRISKTYRIILFILIIIVSFITITYKSILWHEGGELSKKIVESYATLDLPKGQELISVGLPDNLEGAEVFRNNLQQALKLYYPDSYPHISPLPVYVQLNRNNINDHLLKWRQDEMGWFAESVDGGYVVTGMTSIMIEGVYFELWNYNYQNYLANIIRLMPKDELKERILSKEVRLLSFDRGQLVIVE